jgi:hypothetical protein
MCVCVSECELDSARMKWSGSLTRLHSPICRINISPKSTELYIATDRIWLRSFCNNKTLQVVEEQRGPCIFPSKNTVEIAVSDIKATQHSHLAPLLPPLHAPHHPNFFMLVFRCACACDMACGPSSKTNLLARILRQKLYGNKTRFMAFGFL